LQARPIEGAPEHARTRYGLDAWFFEKIMSKSAMAIQADLIALHYQ
jgi:hypothetical protein